MAKIQLLLCCVLVVVAELRSQEVSEKDLAEWDFFKIEYIKEYKSEEEEEKRMKIFLNNLKLNREHNSKFERGDSSYELVLNEESDKTPEELVFRLLGSTRFNMNITKRASLRTKKWRIPKNASIPDEIDWVKKGAVTEVKNQYHCGSCWAFSTVGSIEGQHFIKHGKLVSLSEQNLVDCVYEDSKDCNTDGFPQDAFDYIIENGGIALEESYPYENLKGPCRYSSKNRGAIVNDYVWLKNLSEKRLQYLVATVGPVSASMLVETGLQACIVMECKGVYESPSCNSGEANHAVVIVGYGTTKAGKDYWIVKNSWGPKFGDKGYFRLARNRNNMCLITENIYYPIVQ